MDKQKVLHQIRTCGIMAVIRMQDVDVLRPVTEALVNGGVNVLEITMTVPGAVDIIHQLAGQFDDRALIGAGTVMNAQQADEVIRAGATFVVSPIFKPEIIETCNKQEITVIPGCFTPTEMALAWECGADVVKLFPATKLGSGFIKDVRGPMPQLRIIPTGGVTVENAAEFTKVGAYALGVGTSLLNKKLIASADWEGLSDLAARFVHEVQAGRGEEHGVLV